MVDNISPSDRKRNMRAIKSKGTSLEQLITRALWKRDIRFRKNVNLLYGKPDIAIRKYKVVVFIDSCFWHGCAQHFRLPKSNQHYWEQKIKRNREKDRLVNSYYQSSGWHIMRVWEHDIKNSVDICVDAIFNFIQQARQQHSDL